MLSFSELYDEIKSCTRCPEHGEACYNPDVNTLVLPIREGAKTMLITESPWNYPDKDKTPEDFQKNLNGRLNKFQEKDLDEYYMPKNVFEFIYRTFHPIFSKIGDSDLVGAFTKKVYWTHAGKKSMKKLKDSRERLKAASQCLERLFLEEINAVRPSIMITASSIASRAILGKGFNDLLNDQCKNIYRRNELLGLFDSCKNGSFLGRLREKLPQDWQCQLAVFPNPSPLAARWKKKAYKEKDECIKRVLEHIWKQL